ncbi:hypothetical protein L083_8204 [Actinoplanes sp. N902-109]|nr:hypothetical protein L083_8204 [Actinoplanes sp. N902-109]
MDRPTGLPMVLILECRSHLDIGDLPNLLAAELGVMTVRLERAIRSLDGVARVHVNRWGDGSAHLHMWFLARPYGRLQLRGTFLSLWDDILPAISEDQWRENLALVAAWLAEFGGRAIAEPAHIHWESPSTLSTDPSLIAPRSDLVREPSGAVIPEPEQPADSPQRSDSASELANRDGRADALGISAGEPSAGNSTRNADRSESAYGIRPAGANDAGGRLGADEFAGMSDSSAREDSSAIPRQTRPLEAHDDSRQVLPPDAVH